MLVDVTGTTTSDAVASKDSANSLSRIIVGRFDDVNPRSLILQLVVNNIESSAPYLISGNNVHVVAKLVPQREYNPLPSLSDTIVDDYPVVGGSIKISLPLLAHESYIVTLSPPASSANGFWEENFENQLLRN